MPRSPVSQRTWPGTEVPGLSSSGDDAIMSSTIPPNTKTGGQSLLSAFPVCLVFGSAPSWFARQVNRRTEAIESSSTDATRQQKGKKTEKKVLHAILRQYIAECIETPVCAEERMSTKVSTPAAYPTCLQTAGVTSTVH